MSDCGCEGSCPICRLGEVDDHWCPRCETEFCPQCHGRKKGPKPGKVPVVGPEEMIEPCRCNSN